MSSTMDGMSPARFAFLFLVAFALAWGAQDARATEPATPPAPSATGTAATTTTTTATAGARGFAVLALPGSRDAAWPLAHELYGAASLHNTSVDEAHARVLAGEPAPADASQELRDLADTCAAIKGDDAPSRQLLAGISQRFSLRGIVVVGHGGAAPPTARIFLADTGAFDAAQYGPDAADAGAIAWTGAVQSLARAYPGPQPPKVVQPIAPRAASTLPAPSPTPRTTAPAAALQATPAQTPSGADQGSAKDSKKFYETVWFWGAIGAAAFAAGAYYLATRDDSPSTVHLQVQVPR